MNSYENLLKYRNFLASIPLQEYREKLKNVKWVEQDLPELLLPQESIFKYYWEEKSFLDFENWFENFWEELNSNQDKLNEMKKFKKYYFDKNNDGWFKLGFKARMYRTWTAMLTQLDFCYMLAYLLDKHKKIFKIICNAELDKKGIDLKIANIEFAVSKLSHRKEARSASASRRNRINIPYAVFNIEEYERLSQSSRVKPENQEKYKKSLNAYQKYFEILNNGFVIFSEYYVEQIVNNLENAERLKEFIEKMLRELSGEF